MKNLYLQQQITRRVIIQTATQLPAHNMSIIINMAQLITVLDDVLKTKDDINDIFYYKYQQNVFSF